LIEEYMLNKKEDVKNLTVYRREISFTDTRDFVTAIVGPRRAGKSYYLYHIIKSNGLRDDEYLFLNFEDESLRSMPRKEVLSCVSKHVEIYKKQPKYIFLDEVQAFGHWSNWVYELYEKKKYNIFITGSSSRLLSKEIATQLRGRTQNILILPFSFSEVIKLKGLGVKEFYSTYEKSEILGQLSDYLRNGGFPQLVLGQVDQGLFFRDYLDSVIYRDIVERFKIREAWLIGTLLRFVSTSFSAPFSINKVYNTLKSQGINISKKTLYRYSNFAEQAFFCFTLRKFDFSKRRSELSIPKVYINDAGLVNYLNPNAYNKTGRLMENVVFLDLKEKQFLGRVREISYYRDQQGHEVDFVTDTGKCLMQVTYANYFDEVDRREWRNLISANRVFKSKRLNVITWDYEDERTLNWRGNKETITFIPLWKWLLDSSKYIN
jgi:predicted AAA+ superfamily ATPase